MSESYTSMVEHAPERALQSCAEEPAVDCLAHVRRVVERAKRELALRQHPEESRQVGEGEPVVLAVARAQRDKVARQRAGERKPVVPAAAKAGTPDKEYPVARAQSAPRPEKTPETGQSEAAASVSQIADPPRAPAAGAHVAPPPRRLPDRLRPMLIGLVIGVLAGGALVALTATLLGVVGAQNRAAPAASVPAGASIDAAPVNARARSPSQALSDSLMAPGTAPYAFPQATALAPLDASPILSARGSEPPASLVSALPVSLPALSAPAPASELPALEAGPRIAAPAPDPASGSADRPPPASPRDLATPRTLPPAFAPEQATSLPEARISRVAVYAPGNLSPDRREWAMTRLSETGWPFREATTPLTIRETHVRYFHRQDRAAAERLAILLDTEARDFTNFSPSPADGYLEVWLSGQGMPPPAGPVATRAPEPATGQTRRRGAGLPATGSRQAVIGRESNAQTQLLGAGSASGSGNGN